LVPVITETINRKAQSEVARGSIPLHRDTTRRTQRKRVQKIILLFSFCRRGIFNQGATQVWKGKFGVDDARKRAFGTECKARNG